MNDIAMTTNLAHTDTTYSREAVEQLSQMLGEPAWMREFRLRAWEQFAQTPLPTTQDEPWRRTDLRRFKLEQFGPSLNGAHAAVEVPLYLAAQLTEDQAGGVLVEVNGVATKYELSDQLKEQGVIFTDMHTAVREHPELVRRYFMTQAVTPGEGKFALLHAAFWRGGTFSTCRATRKQRRHCTTPLWAVNAKTYTHTLVVLERRGRGDHDRRVCL
jgi:Fe-S cluster assembly protein SufD